MAFDAKAPIGDWERSKATEKVVKNMQAKGQLSAAVRLSGLETRPAPQEGERVVHLDMVERGFSFLVHNFL